MFGLLKQAIRMLTKRQGYTIIPNWQLDTYPLAQHLRRLFKLLDIDLVLDVGANVGQYYDFLREQVGYQGRVISFEPVPHLAEALHRRAAGSALWRVEGRALGSADGNLNFNVMENTELSSFLNPDHSRVGNLLVDHNEIQRVIKVEVSAIDKILPGIMSEYKSKNIYLKMDTQGFDLEVLRGASNSLFKIAALQTEVAVTPVYLNMPKYDEVIKTLEGLAFSVSGIYPNHFAHFPIAIEFDCCMINRGRIP